VSRYVVRLELCRQQEKKHLKRMRGQSVSGAFCISSKLVVREGDNMLRRDPGGGVIDPQ
jgi:hypothetical protein